MPAAWVATHPLQSSLAVQMVARQPAARPSCAEVLAALLVARVWTQPEAAGCVHAAQVLTLQAQLAARRREVAALRSLLAEHGVAHESVPSEAAEREAEP